MNTNRNSASPQMDSMQQSLLTLRQKGRAETDRTVGKNSNLGCTYLEEISDEEDMPRMYANASRAVAKNRSFQPIPVLRWGSSSDGRRTSRSEGNTL